MVRPHLRSAEQSPLALLSVRYSSLERVETDSPNIGCLPLYSSGPQPAARPRAGNDRFAANTSADQLDLADAQQPIRANRTDWVSYWNSYQLTSYRTPKRRFVQLGKTGQQRGHSSLFCLPWAVKVGRRRGRRSRSTGRLPWGRKSKEEWPWLPPAPRKLGRTPKRMALLPAKLLNPARNTGMIRYQAFVVETSAIDVGICISNAGRPPAIGRKRRQVAQPRFSGGQAASSSRAARFAL